MRVPAGADADPGGRHGDELGVPADRAALVRHRGLLVGGYALIAVAAALVIGDVDRPTVFVAAIGAVLVTCVGSPRPLARTLVAWLPLLVIVGSYDVVRAQTASLVPRAHLDPQLSFDTWLGFGTTPSRRLQDSLYVPGRLNWFDVAALAVYATHFVGGILVAGCLWVRARRHFARFAATILLLTMAGFTTYLVYPAIPPWMASARGALPGVVRVVPRLWSLLGVKDLAHVFSGSDKYSNPVGALPSEHAAYPMLFLLFFWGLTKRRWIRALLVGYTLAMAFVLVYLGEHYVADILLGWLYALVAFLVVHRLAQRRAARLAPVSAGPAAAGAPEEPDA